MNKCYTQLSIGERDRIDNLLRDGTSHRRIGEIVGRDRRTIDREIKRNRVKEKYTSKKADVKKYQRRHSCKKQSKKIRENRELESYIVEKMKEEKRSPEIISHEWNRTHQGKETIHFQRIYDFLQGPFGQKYCEFLYSKRYHPKKRKKNKTKRELLPNRKRIEERNVKWKLKEQYGHIEGDFIISASGDTTVIQTAIEKLSRYMFARKQKNRTTHTTNRVLKKILQGFPGTKSYTTDNDIAFQKYESIQKQTGIPFYYCHPYHSREKGQIENGNRILRKWFPKKTVLKNVSQKEIDKVIEKINNTPRKCLHRKTPKEVFTQLQQQIYT